MRMRWVRWMAAARKTLGEGAMARGVAWCSRQVIAVEARLVGVFQALQALLVQVRELELVTIDPVEDTELHQRRVRPRCGVVIDHLIPSVGPWSMSPGTLGATIVRLPKAVNRLAARGQRLRA